MKQSEVMQKRKENHQEVCERLTQQGFIAENATVSILRANVMAFVVAIPFLVLLILPFRLVNPEYDIESALSIFETFPNAPFFILAIFLSIPIHEGLHGLGWHFFCQKKWKSIQFGIMWDSLTPYCYCAEALTLQQYYFGLLLPCAVLGILISLIGIFSGSLFWLLIGLVNILLAGGDLTIGCVLLKYLKIKSEKKILDHPSECGCTAFLKNN